MAKCWKGFREELRANRFLLDYPNPEHFVQFKFGHPGWYLVYRIVWALYTAAMTVVKGYLSGEVHGVKWFIYLTNWACFFLTVTVILEALACAYITAKRSDIRKGEAKELPWFLKMNWVLFNITNTTGIIIAIGYWAFLYRDPSQLTLPIVEGHVVNIFYIVLNLAVTGVPVRLLHCWHPGVVGVVYGLFTLFYHLAGGRNSYNNTYVYPMLDWNSPGKAVTYVVLTALIFTPLLHGVCYCIHILASRLYRVCACSNAQRYTVRSDDVEK